jgi:protein-export membrane protein SecD
LHIKAKELYFTNMNLTVFRSWAVILLFAGIFLGYQVFSSEKNSDGRHFKYGLDLVGGSHLVYEADTSKLDKNDIADSMSALRNVIERRIDMFGVSEPLIQTEKASVFSGSEKTERLIVELPGITDLNEAIELIGATPQLEFKLVGEPDGTSTEPVYEETGLDGQYLEKANLRFSGQNSGGFANEPLVAVDFNSEGRELFAKITEENVGRELAIFLDGRLISHPVIKEPIRGGTAIISGGFDVEEAKELVRNLNIGALPVPIELASTETVGATLGTEILKKGVKAGLVGFALVLLFMVVWYRLPGLIAGVSLSIYMVLMLAVFKYIPVTITAAGIAGFLLSIGMAVDANVLIFERLKEELENGEEYKEAVINGFKRAWAPIRDGNFTSLISAVILFWFGSSIVQGFALVFGIGILVSMFTAVTLTRTFLVAITGIADKAPFLLKSGFSGLKKKEE